MHDRLEEWLEGSLSAAAAAEFEAHLRGCAECRAEVQRAKTLARLAAALPPPPVPRDVATTIRERLALPRRRLSILRPASVLLAATAAAVVLLLAYPRAKTPVAPLPAPVLGAATAGALSDWLEQARHAVAADTARLAGEARDLELREYVRRRLDVAGAAERSGLLALEDLLTQLMNGPDPDSFPEEARLVARLVGK